MRDNGTGRGKEALSGSKPTRPEKRRLSPSDTGYIQKRAVKKQASRPILDERE